MKILVKPMRECPVLDDHKMHQAYDNWKMNNDVVKEFNIWQRNGFLKSGAYALLFDIRKGLECICQGSSFCTSLIAMEEHVFKCLEVSPSEPFDEVMSTLLHCEV